MDWLARAASSRRARDGLTALALIALVAGLGLVVSAERAVGPIVVGVLIGLAGAALLAWIGWTVAREWRAANPQPERAVLSSTLLRMTEAPLIAPGWYPDPSMTLTLRYWDGAKWTDNVAPIGQQTPAQQPPAQQPTAKPGEHGRIAMALILAGSVIGLIMAMQSASLFTGTGTLWTGAAIACAAAVSAFVMRRSIPRGVVWVAAVVAVISVASVMYVENQLDEQRQEIGNLFN